MLNVSKSTVADIVKRFKYEDRIDSIPQKGQPKKLDARDKRKLIRKIKKDPTLSAPKLAAELLNEVGKKVHPQTIRRALKENGYNGRVARKKPPVLEYGSVIWSPYFSSHRNDIEAVQHKFLRLAAKHSGNPMPYSSHKWLTNTVKLFLSLNDISWQ
ncbi:hypothetical protein KPH14_008495 [Odynerus spinipes]|uniref:Transposase Tc1-like domain-containing protein n=1 Tax=Odynerus spinipes TaxID=1348599 RepID=A0AAD9RHC7_9HYME|nr:hypothetical protein KPH14_008495 [Odynerus spinipes]